MYIRCHLHILCECDRGASTQTVSLRSMCMCVYIGSNVHVYTLIYTPSLCVPQRRVSTHRWASGAVTCNAHNHMQRLCRRRRRGATGFDGAWVPLGGVPVWVEQCGWGIYRRFYLLLLPTMCGTNIGTHFDVECD